MLTYSSKVVVGGSPAGNGSKQNRAPIIIKVIRASNDGGWEIAVSQKTTSEILEVEVQGLVVSLSQSFLHGKLIRVGEPPAVNGSSCPLENIRDTSTGVVGIQHCELFEGWLLLVKGTTFATAVELTCWVN